MLGVVATIVGCSKKDDTLPEPTTAKVGKFADCDVFYVNRGDISNSFYLGKCPAAAAAATITNQYEYRSGKATHVAKTMSITEEIEKNEDEHKALLRKLNALKKLTPEERKELGLELPPQTPELVAPQQ